MSNGPKQQGEPKVSFHSIWVGAAFFGSFGYYYAKDHFGTDASKSINILIGSIFIGGILGYFLAKIGVSIWPSLNGIRLRKSSKREQDPKQ